MTVSDGISPSPKGVPEPALPPPSQSATEVVTSEAPFLPWDGRNHLRYSLHLPMEGWPGWVAWINTGMVHPRKVVTNPSTNRARRSLTSTMRRTPLPLRQTSHQLVKLKIKKAIAGLQHPKRRSHCAVVQGGLREGTNEEMSLLAFPAKQSVFGECVAAV